MAQVLVLGGTGVFGSRIVRRLAASHTVAVGSRHAGPRLPVGVPHVVVDAANLASVRSALQRVRPRVVINAAGPFQYDPVEAAEKFADPALHDAPHVLPRECVSAGASYIDIADNAAWIQRVNELKPPAGGAVVVSGASTMPALTGAVVAHLARGLKEVHAVDIGMSPGNRAPRGAATMRSILSYVGRRSVVWYQQGSHKLVYGWSQMARRRIALPASGPQQFSGRSLRPRWFASVDLPDPLLFPRAFGVRDRVTTRAGLELPVMHWGLAALGLGVRAGLLSDLTRGIRWLHRAASALEGFGSDEGGLYVDVAGVRADTGRPVVRRWALIAGSGDGPNVPALPAAALARQLCAAGASASASSATASSPSPFFPLSLDAILAEARGLDIVTGSEEVPPVYEAAVGAAAYAALPPPIRELHDTVSDSTWRGMAQVAPAATPLGRLIARVFAMPPPGRDVPLRFQLTCENGVERWERHFGAPTAPAPDTTTTTSSSKSEVGVAPRRPFVSQQYVAPTGAFPLATSAPSPPGTIIERFGPLEFGLRVDTHTQGLDLHLVSMTALGFLPVPRALWPAITATERVVDGRFHFDVGISLPGVGRLVRYNGWLVRDAAASSSGAGRMA